MFIARAVLLIFLVALPSAAQTIQLEDGAFRLSGWKANGPVSADALSSIFTVYTGGTDMPPMLGAYSLEGDSIVFRPGFPVVPGMKYLAVYHAPGSPAIETMIDGPAKDMRETTRVEHVYPSTNELAANQLKLYIQFSASMSRGEAWKRIHLLGGDGRPIDLPFVEIEQELWDPSYRRLTVLFDPGRIKRGLVPTNEVGPPIVEGEEFTLVIDRNWMDARGVPLQEEFRKSFRGVAADRTPPDPKKWRLSPPLAETLEALVVDFPEPMDYALLQRTLTVPGISGTVSIERGETQWRFTPNQPWKRSDYVLSIDIALEDLAGNRIDRTFDVDTFEKGPEQITLSLPFRVQ